MAGHRTQCGKLPKPLLYVTSVSTALWCLPASFAAHHVQCNWKSLEKDSQALDDAMSWEAWAYCCDNLKNSLFEMSEVQGGWNSMLASVLHNCNVYTVGVSVGFFSSLLGSRVRCWLSPLARFLHALAPPTLRTQHDPTLNQLSLGSDSSSDLRQLTCPVLWKQHTT